MQALFARQKPAFTPRAQGQKPSGRGRAPFTPPPTAPLSDTKNVGQSGMMDRLTRAVIAGLLRYPDRIEPHFEALMAFQCADPVLDKILARMISAAPAKETLDATGLDILRGDTQLYNSARELLRADGLRFTFTVPLNAGNAPDGPPNSAPHERLVTQAKADLDEAIRVMVARPMLNASLAEATASFERDMTDDAFLEQQRLRQDLNDLDGRLADLMQRDEI